MIGFLGRGVRPDCVARVRMSIKSLQYGTPPRVKDIQTSLLGTLRPQDTNDRVSWSNQQRRSAMSSTFRCDLADLGGFGRTAMWCVRCSDGPRR